MVGLDGGDAEIEIVRLRELYETSPVARAALDHFGRRLKNSRVTTVERLQAKLVELGQEATRNEVVTLLQTLAKYGCGKFVIGRKGQRSRLRWAVGLREVGRVAAGEEVEVEVLDTGEPLEEGEEADAMREHRYWLRPDLELQLALPQDLTEEEAGRLARFVRTLPIT